MHGSEIAPEKNGIIFTCSQKINTKHSVRKLKYIGKPLSLDTKYTYNFEKREFNNADQFKIKLKC